jgi:hypothetical protein
VTLIEVLVCIAGLALLLGQAVPVARQARSDAQLATCLSRLGEITRASAVYSAQDPDETAIPIGERDATSTDAVYSHFSFGGKSGTSTALYPFLLASVFSGNNAMNASRRPLNRILYKQVIPEPDDTCGYTFCMDWSRDARLDLDIYHCPADVGFPGMHYRGWAVRGNSSYNYFGTSYSANAMWKMPSALWIDSPLDSVSPYLQRIGAIPNPQKTVLYLENAGEFAWQANNPELDQSGTSCYWPYNIGNFTAHGNHGTDWMFSTSFVDGHAAFIRMRGHAYLPWTAEPSLSCAPVRGLGWQRDTLPAPPTPTWKIAGGGSSSNFDIVD